MKPIAAVTVEGTLTTGHDLPVGQLGEWKEGVAKRLTELQKDYHILLVSGIVRSPWGLALLADRLYQDSIPFDEIWLGYSRPEAAVYFDDEARKLCPEEQQSAVKV